MMIDLISGYSNIGVKRAKNYTCANFWEVPTEAYFEELKRVSQHQIIFGANYFTDRFKSNSRGWIVLDKDNGASSFADAELAYSSFERSIRIFKYMWNGMHQESYGGDVRRNEERIHPTQKPVALYDWLIANYTQKNWSILDTHLGSGSSAIASHYAGRSFTGCEIDPFYFKAAFERSHSQTKQTELFERGVPHA